MPRIKKPKKPKKPKKEGGMYRLGHQMGLYVTGQADTWRPPSSASLQPPGLQDPTDVFQTDIASPAYQSEQIEYENARKMDAEARKKAREDMIARINHRRSGSGRPITQLDTGPLTGSGMSAPLLKEFIDLSYRGNTSIAPAGWSIDAPLSDSRVKVYAKNGSNDKNIVVTHRGSVGLDDWMDNASYMFRGKVKGTKTYNLHRDRHKRAIDKYGASNIIAIGHSRAGLYLQELQKEFPIKENITYNKASGFHDIGRQNDANQTDVRVGNDIVSLLAPLQRRNNAIVNISGTKNPFDFNAAHQTAEINKVGDQYIGKGRKRGRPRKIGKGDSAPTYDNLLDRLTVALPRPPPPGRPPTMASIEERPLFVPEPSSSYEPLDIKPKPARRPRRPFFPSPKPPPRPLIETILKKLLAKPRIPWRQLQLETNIELAREYITITGNEPTGNDLMMIYKGQRPPILEGSGTLPVISSVEGIKRLIATEQARLRKIKKGYKYESPTMSQEKIEEKIARLKERLKSAKANKGHADVSYFIPKSIKWLKIMADETRIGSDAYNKELLEAVKKLLAELSGKKPTAANKKKTATLEEDQAELEKIIGKKKKGYSKKTPDANKPAPVIIPPSSLTNERANIRAAVNRQRTYNKIIDDKQQEDFKVILKAMIPDPEPAQRTKEEIRKERAREAARRQRERDKPSGFTQAQEYNKATKQRQAKAREYGIPTREYTASLKREAQLKKIEEGLEDEEKKKVIREERNKLKAKYTYLDEIMNSDNTDANIANTSSMGEQPVLVEAEVEPPTAPLAGSGMCGCGLSNDPKFVISGKNEEYKLLY